MATGTMKTIHRDSAARAAGSGGSDYLRRITVVLLSAGGWLSYRLEKRRSRLALLEMTDEQLEDIGVTRAEARREGLRPFWD